MAVWTIDKHLSFYHANELYRLTPGEVDDRVHEACRRARATNKALDEQVSRYLADDFDEPPDHPIDVTDELLEIVLERLPGPHQIPGVNAPYPSPGGGPVPLTPLWVSDNHFRGDARRALARLHQMGLVERAGGRVRAVERKTAAARAITELLDLAVEGAPVDRDLAAMMAGATEISVRMEADGGVVRDITPAAVDLDGSAAGVMAAVERFQEIESDAE